MIKDTVGRVRPGAGVLTCLLRALVVWRGRVTARRRKRSIDRLSDYMLQDVGLPRRASRAGDRSGG